MEMFKLLIIGPADFDDYALLKKAVNHYLAKKKGHFELVIVSGVRLGAEMLAERFAAEYGYEVADFFTDKCHGDQAEYLKIKEMTEYADASICFWDGISIETKFWINVALERKLPLRVINY